MDLVFIFWMNTHNVSSLSSRRFLRLSPFHDAFLSLLRLFYSFYFLQFSSRVLFFNINTPVIKLLNHTIIYKRQEIIRKQQLAYWISRFHLSERIARRDRFLCAAACFHAAPLICIWSSPVPSRWPVCTSLDRVGARPWSLAHAIFQRG